MSPITTHILDTSRGRPAAEVRVDLEHLSADKSWATMGHGKTNADGRLSDLLPAETVLMPGTYRLRFATAAYFQTLGVRSFYPEVQILFLVEDSHSHYHVPLLLSPFGYSTYRGS